MYQNTCHIAPWLREHFPLAVATDLGEHFDMVGGVETVSLAEVARLEHFGIMHVSPRLNLVSGTLGKTRLLEHLKAIAGPAPALPPLPQVEDRALSSGQWLMLVFGRLLSVQPTGTCLLLDDILDHFDRPHQQTVLRLLRAHRRQVVMAVKPHMMRMVAENIDNSGLVSVY